MSRRVRLPWKRVTMSTIESNKEMARNTQMQWSNCSTLLAVASITAEDKGQVEFITSSGSKNDIIVSRACQATCLAWHPFDATIAIGWADGHYNVNVLKGENAEGFVTVPLPQQEALFHVEWSHNGKVLCVVDVDYPVMVASLPATRPRLVKAANPAELICSSSATGTVTKHLVIRNSLPCEVMLKLVLSKEAEKFITLEKKSVRIKTIARLNVQIHADRIGMFGGGGQLKGYVRAYSTSPEVEEWTKVTGKETKRQLAFSMNIRFANVFSARDTILDLPGSAVVFTLDDRDTQTAQAIEDDCITARNCDSIAEYMAEARERRAAARKKKAEPTNWGIYDMANTVAETVKSWYEATPALPAAAPKKIVKKTTTSTTSTRKSGPKSSNNQKSGRSTKVRSSFVETNNGRFKRRTVQMESEYVNHELAATPCGGVAA